MKVSCGWEESEQGGRRRTEAPTGKETSRVGVLTRVHPRWHPRAQHPYRAVAPTEPHGPTALAGRRSVSSLV